MRRLIVRTCALALALALLTAIGPTHTQPASADGFTAAPAAAHTRNSPAASSLNEVFVAYNPALALGYAATWVHEFNNSDGCYVGGLGANQGSICFNLLSPPPQNTRRDAAHFLSCALNAAGIARIGGKRTCGSPGEGNGIFARADPVILNFDELTLSGAFPAGWQVVPDLASVQPGDLVVFSIPSDPRCWGGLISVVDAANNRYTFAQHSTGEEYITADSQTPPQCIDKSGAFINASPTFLRLNADYTPPEDLLLEGGVADYPPEAVPLRWFARDSQSGLGGASASTPPAGSWGGGYQVQVWDGAGWQNVGEPMDLDAEPQEPQPISVDLSAHVGMCTQAPVRLLLRDNVGNESSVEDSISVLQEGDLTGDGQVDQGDLDALAPHLGAPLSAANARFDLTEDGQINGADRLWLLQRQGNSCDIKLP